MVFIHAGIRHRRMWDDQFAVFARARRVMRYDLRGFGASSLPAAPYTHHDDLAGLLRALKIERATLIAVSFGAEIALQTALVHPGFVAGLILSTTRAAATHAADAVKRLWRDADAAYEAGDLAAAVEIESRGWVDGPFRSPDQVNPAVRERVRVMNTAFRERVADSPAEAEESPFEPPIQARLAEIAVPTLLVTGDLDQPEVVESMSALAAAIPGAESIVIPGTAHLPSLEQPAAFNRAISDFLARHDL